jgi:tripartite-type tricarboxylate transporter receptor subunit TctC
MRPAAAVAPLLFWALLPPVPAGAAYPDRPLRLITGFLPGGVSDVLARVIGERLGERLGQRVVIDGRPGAGGMVSMEIAARATPDGYTLYLAQPVISIAAVVKKDLAFDPVKAFAPLSLIGTSPTLVVAHLAIGIGTPAELVAAAKAKPGGLNYGSSGQGGPNHLAAELFQHMAGVRLVHVPYKGAGAALPAVLGNEVPLAFTPLLAGIPHVKSGRLRAVGITSAKRVRAVPDIPPLADAVPGYDHASWFGFVVPAATPKPIVARLHGELLKVMALPDVREKLVAQGVEPDSSRPEGFGKVIADDVTRWTRVIRDTGIRID